MSPLVIVAGMGRCGSSLMMQMLDAGGLRCAGTAPMFEEEGLLPGATLTAEWCARFDAVKLLHPHAFTYPDGLDALVVWMDRHPEQQAMSQIKLIRHTSPEVLGEISDDDAIASIVTVLADHRRLARSSLARFPFYSVRFERLIEAPGPATHLVIRRIAKHIGRSVDAAAMLSVVAARSPECAPGLEPALMRRIP